MTQTKHTALQRAPNFLSSHSTEPRAREEDKTSGEIIGIMLSANFFLKVSFATKINLFLRQKSEPGKCLHAFVWNFSKSEAYIRQ